MFKHDHIFHEREQETILNTYIDTLAEWWEHAEQGEAEPGDWIITHGTDDTNPAYIIEQAPRYPLNSKRQPYRILARAPKPKPAWHDAKAVIAEVHAFDRPRVFVKDYEGIWNDAFTGRGYSPDALSHVTPLIEAKVTQPMIDRARAESMKWEFGGLSGNAVDSMLTAALGLDPA